MNVNVLKFMEIESEPTESRIEFSSISELSEKDSDDEDERSNKTSKKTDADDGSELQS
jgi:hypothetical protein